MSRYPKLLQQKPREKQTYFAFLAFLEELAGAAALEASTFSGLFFRFLLVFFGSSSSSSMSSSSSGSSSSVLTVFFFRSFNATWPVALAFAFAFPFATAGGLIVLAVKKQS